MDPSFGVRLRSVRERQRIALSTIAEQTKIKRSLLEALERDDVSQWPHGIFGRSHLRAYAQAIGLDPGAVVAEFLEVHPDPDEEIPAILEAAQRGGGESANRPPRTRIRFLFDSAIDALQGLRHQRSLNVDSGRGIVAGTMAPATGYSRGHSESEDSGGRATGLIVRDDKSRDQRTSSDIERELTSLAQLCTRIGRAHQLRDVVPVLEDALDLIDAVGLVLWIGDQDGGFLTPVLALGYSNDMIARLPRVPRDADNAIAAAFRSAETKIVGGSDMETGAVAVPLVTAAGCVGVLAVEWPSPGERRAFLCAFASILTAQLGGLVGPLPTESIRTTSEGAAPAESTAARCPTTSS